jgi:hypothetical protein
MQDVQTRRRSPKSTRQIFFAPQVCVCIKLAMDGVDSVVMVTWQTLPPKISCAQRGSEKPSGQSGTSIALNTPFHTVMACFDISVERSILFVRVKLRRSLGDTRSNIWREVYH